jgi:hypothetical protein
VQEGAQARIDQASRGVVGAQREVVERGQPRQRLDAAVGADARQGDVRLLVGARRPSGPRRSCVRCPPSRPPTPDQGAESWLGEGMSSLLLGKGCRGGPVADATSRAISRSDRVAPITRQLLLGARQGEVSSRLDKLEASSRLQAAVRATEHGPL